MLRRGALEQGGQGGPDAAAGGEDEDAGVEEGEGEDSWFGVGFCPKAHLYLPLSLLPVPIPTHVPESRLSLRSLYDVARPVACVGHDHAGSLARGGREGGKGVPFAERRGGEGEAGEAVD
jgi:hypothetical protein